MQHQRGKIVLEGKRSGITCANYLRLQLSMYSFKSGIRYRDLLPITKYGGPSFVDAQRASVEMLTSRISSLFSSKRSLAVHCNVLDLKARNV